MTPTPQAPTPPRPAGPGQPRSSLRHRLAELETALRNALLLGCDLPDHVLADLSRQVADLAAAAGAAGESPPEDTQACLDHLRRIGQVHDQLTCRLKQHPDETAAQLARLRQGKRGISAYKGGA